MTVGVVDSLMERASRALEATRYFEAERLCVKALERAHARRDYARMSRIILPLLESRRQRRQAATEAAEKAVVVAGLPRGVPRPGCYLLQPPCIGADAHRWRRVAAKARVPVYVLVREPMTEKRLWPLVAVSEGAERPVSVRVLLPPPRAFRRLLRRPSRDSCHAGVTISLEWFEEGGEALGDAAIASVDSSLHPAWRVDDLMVLLSACPDHEKLHQRLDDACREALTSLPPEGRRPRPWVDDPFRF